MKKLELTEAERLEIADLLLHAATSMEGTANCLIQIAGSLMATTLRARAQQARLLAEKVSG